ncbi:HEPN domain-containing protein [Enterobacter hormaechei subsp. xiangfangensis]|jgi:hypothetical protein|uniref:Apea-like HEPN domain-containing protein n=1 Tax=Enterobacter hormaechei TaxID=158836 RepID=A0A822X6E0_9ENTR|nr:MULTISPECIES: HEPN domain-containing protein [Enterobacter cloacae complex]ELJ6236648.1 hypothetical protein [Enterobacter hormaechei]ELZ5040331.1 hypothetical protein [Enterobacter hormaechei]MBT1744401.1 hypothetical protein [Enterobacter hormaechei subsp. xiangfangensis]MCL8090382.1 HEPN domain-containing protein [Enterobacter hormaechei]MCM8073844.1 HEPN domain-containing protein [Enterobacter hormaechei]
MEKEYSKDRLLDLTAHFERRKQYASEKIKHLREQHEICFALSGLTFSKSPYIFEGIGVLREVLYPPGEIELAAALKNKSLLSPIARHMPALTHELALQCCNSTFQQTELNIGWWILSAIRCRTLIEVLVPAVANVSWDVFPAMNSNSCEVQLLEDVPATRRIDTVKELSLEALDWVQQYLENWITLLEFPAFRLAIDSLTTHNQHANLRMSAAALWAGIEALFGINSELRFRLAIMAAAYLEERGVQRLEAYRRIKKLYDYRSKAVHGGVTSDHHLVEHIIEVRKLLSQLVCRMTELGRMPTVEDYEERLLT